MNDSVRFLIQQIRELTEWRLAHGDHLTWQEIRQREIDLTKVLPDGLWIFYDLEKSMYGIFPDMMKEGIND
jgi:hypothetical protein